MRIEVSRSAKISTKFRRFSSKFHQTNDVKFTEFLEISTKFRGIFLSFLVQRRPFGSAQTSGRKLNCTLDSSLSGEGQKEASSTTAVPHHRPTLLLRCGGKRRSYDAVQPRSGMRREDGECQCLRRPGRSWKQVPFVVKTSLYVQSPLVGRLQIFRSPLVSSQTVLESFRSRVALGKTPLIGVSLPPLAEASPPVTFSLTHRRALPKVAIFW